MPEDAPTMIADCPPSAITFRVIHCLTLSFRVVGYSETQPAIEILRSEAAGDREETSSLSIHGLDHNLGLGGDIHERQLLVRLS